MTKVKVSDMPMPGNSSRRPDADHFSEQVSLYNSCDFARLLGMEIIEASPGFARVIMDPDGKENPNGVLHGGAVFAVADQAFGIAANMEEPPEVAVSAGIWFLAPASGRLEAVARRISESGDHSLYCVQVFAGEKMVAIFEGVGIKNSLRTG
jgi:acyl-CoA thioesterase